MAATAELCGRSQIVFRLVCAKQISSSSYYRHLFLDWPPRNQTLRTKGIYTGKSQFTRTPSTYTVLGIDVLQCG